MMALFGPVFDYRTGDLDTTKKIWWLLMHGAVHANKFEMNARLTNNKRRFYCNAIYKVK